MTFTPFDPSRGLIVIPVSLRGPGGGTTAELALDTGATTTMVRTSMLELIGYAPGTSSGRVRVTTGSGVEFTPRVVVSELRALGLARRRFTVLAHTLPPSAAVDGVLGLDFLRGRRLLIDFRAGRIEID